MNTNTKDPVVVVNENDEVIGTAERERSHREGIPHRVVAVYVENEDGEILIHERISRRLDHSVGGHVDPGESYEEAAVRELEEELGITGAPLTEIRKCKTEVKYPDIDQHRVHVFSIFKCQGEPVELDPEEVRSVHWADPQVVMDDMRANPDDMTYSEGFRATLKVYFDSKPS